VIVVWFQNARQKARKNYENQGDGKEGERRELTNDRYIRTSNLNYQCKKCSLVFQRIFDLIKHQKKLCYKDEDEDMQDDSQNEDSMDATDMLTPSSSSCSTPMPFQTYSTAGTASTNAGFSQQMMDLDDAIMCSSKLEALNDDKPKHYEIPRTQQNQTQEQPFQPKQEPQQPQTTQSQPPQQDQLEQKVTTTPQKHLSLSSPSTQPSHCSLTQSSPNTSQISHHSMKPLHSSTPQQLANLPPQLIPYQCDQCKLAFPSFEHWQEHQQLHFLSAQNQFIHPQFLDRPMDMPFMLFDPSNPLLASQLLSGGLSQMPTGSATSPSAPSSTMNTLKRKLEEKASASPGENDSGTGGEEPQRDKRLRTTITPEQLEILYQKYLLDSNPTRKMLDHIAHEVGLKKRVVQVWFQNTRARERKGQFRAVGPAQAHRRCPFCRALFKAKTALEAHIRSRHWHEAKRAGYNMSLSTMLVDCDGSLQLKGDLFDNTSFHNIPHSSSDGPCISLSPVGKSMDLSPRTLLSPSSIKVEGSEDFESPSMSSVNLSFDQAKLDNDDCSSVNTALTDTTTGDEGNADNDSTTALSSPKSSVMGVSNTTVPSPGLPTSGQPNKQPPKSLSPTIPSQTHLLPASQSQELLKEKESEKVKEKERGKGKGDPSLVLKKEKGETLASTSSSMPGMEYIVDSSQLQALQAALTSDPSALLTSPFLPYFVPGFSPYYGAQIPGTLPGGYLQPMYGMEGLFPYNPAISQALMGLSPSSLLQQYQQYQQSLQEALQQQQRQLQMQQKQQQQHHHHHHQRLQQQQQPKASQTPTPSVVSPSEKYPAKDSLKLEEQNPVALEVSHSNKPPEHQEAESQVADCLLDPFIVPKVQYKLVCRKCELSFSSEEAAISHLKSLCFFGQSVVNLQELVTCIPTGDCSGSYRCLGCEATLCGGDALRQHLESPLHKHRTIKRTARNAKEHPSLLPHSACFPNPDTASTSQSAADSKASLSPPFPLCFSPRHHQVLVSQYAQKTSASPHALLIFNSYLKSVQHLRGCDLLSNRRFL
ncbi:unnamed protein product, partial [Staurois parvus]